MTGGARPCIGTQGWSYGDWVGPFYPAGTRSSDMLASYAQAFPAVEVDATFYHIPAEPALERWRESVPGDFVFALKVPQEITHVRHLADCQPLVHRFLERVSLLGERLGPLLVQLSPTFGASAEHRARLVRFVEGLSADFQWVVEVRDKAWLSGETLELLASRRIALALVDGRWIPRERMLEMVDALTSGCAYVRWMGWERRFRDFSRVQDDARAEFDHWTPALRRLSSRVGRLFVFVNNHVQGHAPHTARELQHLLGVAPVAPESLREQEELF